MSPRDRLASIGLPQLVALLGLALTFWEPIMGPTLVGVGFIGEAIRGAFPSSERPSALLAKRLEEVEARLGRVELRAGMHR